MATHKSRKYSNEFLNIGAGARGLAMGGAVISNHQNDVYVDVESSWFDRSRKRFGKRKCTQNISESIANTIIFLFAKALDSKDGVLGISIVRLGVDNILNTTQMIDSEGNIDYDKISKFSTSDYAGIIYAFQPSGNQN